MLSSEPRLEYYFLSWSHLLGYLRLKFQLLLPISVQQLFTIARSRNAKEPLIILQPGEYLILTRTAKWANEVSRTVPRVDLTLAHNYFQRFELAELLTLWTYIPFSPIHSHNSWPPFVSMSFTVTLQLEHFPDCLSSVLFLTVWPVHWLALIQPVGPPRDTGFYSFVKPCFGFKSV